MIVAGTGHRPEKLGGYGPKATARTYTAALRSLEHLKPERVISGMALGWDQALAQAAIDTGIPFIAAVPFIGQERMWPTASRDRYRTLLDKAAEIVVVSEGGYSSTAMQARNIWMVDHCDRVLALWNGDTVGGTANCIRYARHRSIPISNAWKLFLAL